MVLLITITRKSRWKVRDFVMAHHLEQHQLGGTEIDFIGSRSYDEKEPVSATEHIQCVTYLIAIQSNGPLSGC